MTTITSRVCTECGETKPMEQFSLHSRHGTTRRAKCKPCSSAIQKDWRYRYYPRLDIDEPAVLTPLATQWELSCQLCGDCREFRWTAEEARTVSLYLLARRIKCQRCSGWLVLQPGMLSVRDRVQGRGEAA